MRVDKRVVAVVAVGLASVSAAGTRDAAAQASNPCPPGKDEVTITFAMQGGQCAVEGSVPGACVHRGKKIRWTLVNRDCTFDESKTAVEMTQPKKDKDSFDWGCVPKKNGWKKGTTDLTCEVPAGTAENTYKYGIKGQIKPLDPDIEVRR